MIVAASCLSLLWLYLRCSALKWPSNSTSLSLRNRGLATVDNVVLLPTALSAPIANVALKPVAPPSVKAPGAYDVPAYGASVAGKVNGEIKKWHKITIGFVGLSTGERSVKENPFTDFRLDVAFAHTATGQVRGHRPAL